jgi:hypothetical protein
MKRRHMLTLVPLLLIGLAGCSSGSGGAGGEADKEAGLKYAQCMRDNGVPGFEDPKVDENGELDGLGAPKGVDEKTVEAAQKTCAKYLPNGGAPEQMNPEDVAKIRAYAKCLRENGMPGFPDPDTDGRIRFESGKTLDPDSPEMKAADEKCKHNMPGGGGIVFGQGKDK